MNRLLFSPASWNMAGVSGMSMRFAPAAVAEPHWPSRMASRAPWVATREEEQAARTMR